jgi:tRNA C32,U32 (ribose-2'-O)-methylase TrmJ
VVGTSREFAGRSRRARRAQEAVAQTVNGDVALVFGTEMSGLTNDEAPALVAAIPPIRTTLR